MAVRENKENKVKIVSLMRHSVDITLPDGRSLNIPPSGKTVGIDFDYNIIGYTEEGVPMYDIDVKAFHNIPPEKEGVIYLVPAMVKNFFSERKDIVALYSVQRVGKLVTGSLGVRVSF